jgi:hypothetical protein
MRAIYRFHGVIIGQGETFLTGLIVKKIFIIPAIVIALLVPGIGWYSLKTMPMEYLVLYSLKNNRTCYWFLKNFRGGSADIERLKSIGGFNFIFAGYHKAMELNKPDIETYNQRTVAIADFFLQKGLNINAVSPVDGLTALHAAVVLNQPQVVNYLLRHGADKTKPDGKFKLTPTELAKKLQDDRPDSDYSPIIKALTE